MTEIHEIAEWLKQVGIIIKVVRVAEFIRKVVKVARVIRKSNRAKNSKKKRRTKL